MTLLTSLVIDSVGLLQFIEQIHDIEKTLDPAIEFVSNNQDNLSFMEKMYVSANHHISYRFSVTGLFQNNHKSPRYELIDIDLPKELQKIEKLLVKHISRPSQIQVTAGFSGLRTFKKKWFTSVYDFDIDLCLRISYSYEPRKYFQEYNESFVLECG